MPGATVALRSATTPDPIGFAFSPISRQVATPEPDAQDSVLVAAVDAGPGVIEMPEICAGE